MSWYIFPFFRSAHFFRDATQSSAAAAAAATQTFVKQMHLMDFPTRRIRSH